MHGKWGFLQEQLRIDYQSIEKSGLKWEFPHHRIDVPERQLPSQHESSPYIWLQYLIRQLLVASLPTRIQWLCRTLMHTQKPISRNLDHWPNWSHKTH